MASTRELRRRIRSVKNTAQITKAMQMVAATKMRRAQAQALAGRPYSQTLESAMSNLLTKVNPENHLLLLSNGESQIAVLMLTTDKSLCGALNSNLFRTAQAFYKENNHLHFFTVGRKGRDFTVKTGKDLKADFENPEKVNFRQAKQIAKLLMETYLGGEYGQVYILYPQFISALRQEPTLTKLLPLTLNVIPSDSEGSLANASTSNKLRDSSAKPQNDNSELEFLLEPTADELLDDILTHFVEIKVYQSLLETKASEWSARMVAMQNATDNAQELVEDLTLSYNQTRQGSITRELLEITTAAAALE